jgi:anti-anti-sigma factor
MGGVLRDELPGAIAVVDENGVPVIRLTGEIDAQVVAAWDDAPSAAVIDASGVTFLDCRGLGFLIRQARAARGAGAQPVLRRPTRIVRRVIDLAGAGACFTITL